MGEGTSLCRDRNPRIATPGSQPPELNPPDFKHIFIVLLLFYIALYIALVVDVVVVIIYLFICFIGLFVRILVRIVLVDWLDCTNNTTKPQTRQFNVFELCF